MFVLFDIIFGRNKKRQTVSHETIGTHFLWLDLVCHLCYIFTYTTRTLRWRHNDHDSVSNHQPHGCLLNRLFRRRSKKTSKLRVTGLCVGNSPGPMNSPHKGPVTRKMFPFDDVIMSCFPDTESLLWLPEYQWRKPEGCAYPCDDDVIKWKHFPHYWPFVRGIHRSSVNSPQKGQWRGALMLSLICAWINGWVIKSWCCWFETQSRPLWRHCNGQ